MVNIFKSDEGKIKLTEENKDDIFICNDCRKPNNRTEILNKWIEIPFCDEEKKQYYCGCNGWG